MSDVFRLAIILKSFILLLIFYMNVAFNFRAESTIDISERQCGNVALRLSGHLEYTFRTECV